MIVLTIASRELRATFNTTIGWLVLAGFLLMTGFFWGSMVAFYMIQVADVVTNPYAAQQMNLTDYLLSPFFGNTSVVLLMLCPALSMRLFAEELKQKTLELLLTSPVSTMEIVLGKFLGAVGFIAVMLLCTAYIPATLYVWGTPDMGAIAGGYLSLFAISSAIIAMGMTFSASTDNQIVALVLTFSGALMMWVLSWADSDPDSIFAAMSMVGHVEDFMKGVVNLSDVVYFLAFIGFFLFVSHQRIESHRWS